MGHKAKVTEKYITLIKDTLDHLAITESKCQIFCKPIGMVCKELCTDLGLPNTDHVNPIRRCTQMIQRLMQEDNYIEFLGFSRITMAGSLVYIAAIMEGCRETQRNICKTLCISMPSLARCYKKIVRKLRCQVEV